MEKEITKRYNNLLERSFKNDLHLFLFKNFIAGAEQDLINADTYKAFLTSEELILHYISIFHLPKLTDEISGTGLLVGHYDIFLKEWLKQNQLLTKELKTIYASRFISLTDFTDFYLHTPKHCFYCNITIAEIELLLSQRKLFSKMLFIRGRTLEIDRKNSLLTYTKGNLAFACYWCNNAKTDEFSAEEFKPIGEHIRHIWEVRKEKKL